MKDDILPVDHYGPEYVVRVSEPSIGMEGVLVIDNTVLGPGKGGIRMTAGVSIGEVYRLARTMTWKNSLAGIPFGGAKAGLVIPQGTTKEKKKQLVQSFAKKLAGFFPGYYIGGPDVNSGETEMKWIVQATKEWDAVTGKPAGLCISVPGKGVRKCGIPHEFGSTGFGVAQAAKVAAELAGIPMKGASVAIHGFGNVGTFAYKFLTEMGANVTVIADHTGARVAKDGFDPKQIATIVKRKGTISEYKGAASIFAEDFWKQAVDILIPASVTDVINESNKRSVKAKIIVEGGNIAMSDAIEEEFWNRGIVIVPDFVANAGGVISSYAEYQGYGPEKMFALVKRKIIASTTAVVKESLRTKKNPRTVALRLAKDRVDRAMKNRNTRRFLGTKD